MTGSGRAIGRDVRVASGLGWRGNRLVICVGPIRTGTTWLFETMRRHPHIATPSGKEIDYFNHNFERGEDWYLGQFPESVHGGRTLLDVSPHYLDLTDLVERIACITSEPRIIVGIRNPYDRLVSDYRRHYSDRRFAFMVDDPMAWQRTCRANLIAGRIGEMFERFGRGNVIIYNFDDLRRSPKTVCEYLCRSIGLDVHTPPNVERPVLDSVAPRSRTLLAAARLTLRVVARVAPRTADDLMFSRLRWLFYSKRPEGTILPAERAAVFERCAPVFEKEIGSLERLLSLDLTHWRMARATSRQETRASSRGMAVKG